MCCDSVLCRSDEAEERGGVDVRLLVEKNRQRRRKMLVEAQNVVLNVTNQLLNSSCWSRG